MKIALIGSAPSSVQLGPYLDQSYDRFLGGKPAPSFPASDVIDEQWEIWGVSPGAFAYVPRADRWFEVHRWEPGKPWFSPEYVHFLQNFRGPVYTGGVIPEIPNHVVYPIERVEAEFSAYFLHSSLSLMMAVAILEIEDRRKHPKQNLDPVNGNREIVDEQDDVIGLWGVDMAACTSYDTRVLTADLRWVRADEVGIGDKLIAFDEEPQPNGESTKKRMWRTAEVLRADRITKPCYRLTLEDGRTLICSDEHKWLTHAENECRWKMAKDLVTPQHRHPSRIVKLCDVWEEDRSWEAGYLAAAFDGEGHLVQKMRDNDYALLRAGFAQRDNAMLAEVRKVCETLGFDLSHDASSGAEGDECLKHTIRGGRAKTMEFLGRVRPRRLLEKFTGGERLGIMQKADTVAVVASEFIGEQPVIALKTSTGTFVAEGLASHNSEEYGYQRTGCQHFILEALRRGIAVYVPPESCLLRPSPVYGLSEWSHDYIKATTRAREIGQRAEQAQQQLQASHDTLQVAAGERAALNYFIQTWMSPYGLPAGQRVSVNPGTGLGGGFTLERPIDTHLHSMEPAPAESYGAGIHASAAELVHCGVDLGIDETRAAAMAAQGVSPAHLTSSSTCSLDDSGHPLPPVDDAFMFAVQIGEVPKKPRRAAPKKARRKR